MVKSMTGYGRARQMRSGRDITVEVRSVNNRYLDCTVKMPRAYIFAEDAIKSRVQKAVSRGKVDVFITINAAGADNVKISVNEPVYNICAMIGIDDYNYFTKVFKRYTGITPKSYQKTYPHNLTRKNKDDG